MEQKELKVPYVENLLRQGRTDLEAERKKSADEVAFWEECQKSDDPLAIRQANGNIESARGRLKQLNEYIDSLGTSESIKVEEPLFQLAPEVKYRIKMVVPVGSKPSLFDRFLTWISGK